MAAIYSKGTAWSAINKQDTALLKGIAILLIVTHNFFHLVKDTPAINEFNFGAWKFKSFLVQIIQEYPDTIRIVLTYLGHYGVQVFIFLSAYGLTKKYLTADIVYKDYLLDRFNKLYPAFLLSLLFYLAYGFVTHGPLGPLILIQDYWGAILLKLTLISNLLPNQALRPVGPWWFLSFIFQFYLVFPFLLSMARKYGEYTLAIISCAGILLSFLSRNSDVNVYFTIIGHMPELCLGIYLAGKDKLHVPYYMVFTIFLLFILGNLYFSFWLISHFCALILMLLIFNSVRHAIYKHGYVNNLLVFYGTLSMYLFFVHGFLREPMVSWAREYDNWAYSLLLSIAFLAIATISSYVLQTAELKIRQWLAQRELSPDLL